VLEKVADEFAGRVAIVQIDAEGSPILSGQYGIRGVPTLLFFRGGLLVDEFVGAPPIRLLREKLEELAPRATAEKK
jgi:thioredoxin 1